MVKIEGIVESPVEFHVFIEEWGKSSSIFKAKNIIGWSMSVIHKMKKLMIECQCKKVWKKFLQFKSNIVIIKGYGMIESLVAGTKMANDTIFDMVLVYL